MLQIFCRERDPKALRYYFRSVKVILETLEVEMFSSYTKYTHKSNNFFYRYLLLGEPVL